jgi:hypothetical protein
MSDTLCAALASLLPSFWIGRILGLGHKPWAWPVAVRFMVLALLLIGWALLGLPPLRSAALCLLWGAWMLPWPSRRLWGWVAGILLGAACYTQALLAAYHGQGFLLGIRFPLVFVPCLMLSFSGKFSRRTAHAAFFISFAIGTFACL